MYVSVHVCFFVRDAVSLDHGVGSVRPERWCCSGNRWQTEKIKLFEFHDNDSVFCQTSSMPKLSSWSSSSQEGHYCNTVHTQIYTHTAWTVSLYMCVLWFGNVCLMKLLVTSLSCLFSTPPRPSIERKHLDGDTHNIQPVSFHFLWSKLSLKATSCQIDCLL